MSESFIKLKIELKIQLEMLSIYMVQKPQPNELQQFNDIFSQNNMTLFYILEDQSKSDTQYESNSSCIKDPEDYGIICQDIQDKLCKSENVGIMCSQDKQKIKQSAQIIMAYWYRYQNESLNDLKQIFEKLFTNEDIDEMQQQIKPYINQVKAQIANGEIIQQLSAQQILESSPMKNSELPSAFQRNPVIINEEITKQIPQPYVELLEKIIKDKQFLQRGSISTQFQRGSISTQFLESRILPHYNELVCNELVPNDEGSSPQSERSSRNSEIPDPNQSNVKKQFVEDPKQMIKVNEKWKLPQSLDIRSFFQSKERNHCLEPMKFRL